jgi:hypothetical protein
MRKSQSSTGSRRLRAGLATGAAAAVVIAGTATPAFAASAPLTLSSTAGSTAGGNTITASSTTPAAYLTGSTTPVTWFSIPTCVATYTAAASTAAVPSSNTVGNVISASTRKLSNTKATILVPALLVVPNTVTSTKYNVCTYSSTTLNAPLIGTATYTVAAAPTFGGSPIAPASGPALGGGTITISGTGLPTTAGSISATLGGTALTSVTPVSTTAFTAVAPSHAPGPVNLVVTTAAGPQTITGAYTYANGITITPNTAPSATATAVNPVYVDVAGAGFSSDIFGSSGTNSRVWLVDGLYNPDVSTGGPSYLNGPSAECTGVVVISDNELICSMNLATGLLVPATGVTASPVAAVPNGTYTLTVVSNGAIGAGDADPALLQTDISSGSTFTVAPY